MTQTIRGFPDVGPAQASDDLAMFHDINNLWDWVMVVPLALAWLLVLGAAIFAAARTALQHHHRTPLHH